MKILTKVTALILVIFFFTNCEEEGPQFQQAGPHFSLDLFEQNIIDYVNFGNDPIGWGYVINQNGQLARSNAYGDARTAVDGQIDFTISKEANIASVSKFYTAIGAMQLIYANGLTIDSLIAPWLPASWTKGPGVNSLTFKDLLTHTSGLQSTNSNFSVTLGYEGLKTCIATGVVNPKTSNYLNVNFALFRVLIPSLWDPLSNNAIDIEVDANTQFMYLLYMQENVWDVINLPLVGCMPEARETCTLYYNTADAGTSTPGTYYGDWNPMCGGGGYFMSLLEMAKLNAYFEHTEDLVSDELKQIMKTNRIGMDGADNADEIHGNYYGKGGSISNGSNQGVRTQIVMFPFNGIDIAINMNTQGMDFQGTTSLRQMIYDAYNDAWE
ncbi:MAG: serine hydrolase [Chitinophagales bacterium]